MTEFCEHGTEASPTVGLVRRHCDHKPFAVHVYGVYEVAGKPRDFPMNEVELCESCGYELWALIRDSVTCHHMYYELRRIPSDDERSAA